MKETWAVDALTALRRTPNAYWILAVALGVILYLLGDVTPIRYDPFGNGYDNVALYPRLSDLGVLLSAAAPVVALRAPLAAVAAAAGLPVLLGLAADNHPWPFTAFLALVAVALCAQWDAPRPALLIALGAVLLPVSLQAGGSMQMPDGSQIDLRSTDLPVSTVTFALYLIAVLLLFGAGHLFKRRVVRGLAGQQALARAGQVEEQSAVVAERSRLARDLHDVVAHHVSLIAVRAETAPYTHPDLEPAARGVLAEIAADARLALDELRGVLGILGRAGEDASRLPQPAWEDIDALVERARSGGTVVILAGDGEAAPVGASVGYAAYRVVQEGLTNARKHAPGRPVTVGRTATAGLVVVRVATPLRGEPVAAGSGHGLVGMRERVEALGGRLEAGSVGDDFVVEATLPHGTA